MDKLHGEKVALSDELWDHHKKFIKQNIFRTEYDKIKAAAKAVGKENSKLCNERSSMKTSRILKVWKANTRLLKNRARHSVEKPLS